MPDDELDAQDECVPKSRYWTHSGDCGVPFRHVHYGKSIVLHADEHGRPLINQSADVSDES